jgi:hypothetical protein
MFCFVFLFYTVSLLEILLSSYPLELPSLFADVESSGQVESCLPKKNYMSSSLALKKNCSFAWCGSSSFFLGSVLVCVLILLHFFLLVVVSFVALLRVLFS